MAFQLPPPSCFLLLLLLVLPCSIFSQTHKNMTLGSSLTPLSDNSSWPSPSGDFVFGFRKVGADGYLLAIWFNKVIERTIVWSANRNNPVPEGSRIELTSDGKFMLSDSNGKQIWMPEASGTGVAYAAMLDTGNFILVDLNSVQLWETFDVPTDTILPSQTLNQNSKLYARFSATNYSGGRFLFELQINGNLFLYTTSLAGDTGLVPYWSTETSKGSGFQFIFNQSGSIYLTAENGTILNMVLSNIVSMQDFYQRATLDYDGVFRHYVYPKSTDSNISRDMAWSTLSFIPSNICVRMLADYGAGACGFNSFCRHDEGRPICACPKGYTIIDPNDVLKGCKQNFPPQNCDEASQEIDLFYFEETQSTDWPNAQYEKYTSVTEDSCRQACLGDCLCDLFFYKDNVCWKKRAPLLNGRKDPTVGGKALIKIRKDNSTFRSGCRITKKKDNSTLILTGIVLLGIFLSCLLPFIAYTVVSRICSRKRKVIQPYPAFQGENLKCFSYEELQEATGEFKEELGRGASATVFKGILASGNVAVKSLHMKVRESDYEFNAEMNAIGRTNHRNLVKLLGYCNEGQASAVNHHVGYEHSG